MSRWIVFGAGGHATSLVDVLRSAGHDVVSTVGIGGIPGVPNTESDHDATRRAVAEGLNAALGIGANALRLRLLVALRDAGVAMPPVVARTATVGAGAVLGSATLVAEHAHVGPGCDLGAAVVINTGAIVEHDCLVGHGTHVAPGAVVAGGARIGREVLVGAGATVLPGVTLRHACTIGAGAVATRDVAEGTTVAGVPAHAVDSATDGALRRPQNGEP